MKRNFADFFSESEWQIIVALRAALSCNFIKPYYFFVENYITEDNIAGAAVLVKIYGYTEQVIGREAGTATFLSSCVVSFGLCVTRSRPRQRRRSALQREIKSVSITQ
jgi:hypothetical protein